MGRHTGYPDRLLSNTTVSDCQHQPAPEQTPIGSMYLLSVSPPMEIEAYRDLS
jgi:hypothetical protein